ncbi:flagellar biosynthesis repressor FlbT [Rhodoblastus sp.]|jgi:flagellar protein FlbT|uniref:flagellar biosynthesis repressor FlbT n=1 Tax=Rhodoblastus sp. TaxID=1962975 RepID=UPI00261F4524|nr:flagellar biosynthesis repressor FlbT [Rhodoblastus sp.]
MLLKLRAGEKLYLNGAVIRVERKATIELLNDATFLLEAHVMQPDEASTPLRQLYFVLQTELMEREAAPAMRTMFRVMLADTCAAIGRGPLVEGLRRAEDLAEAGRAFEALKALRALFSQESQLFSAPPQQPAAA